MIVQCDQCNAKFRLDDSKVKEGGAKVRCSKCKHIFVVQRETPAEETDYDSLLDGLVSSSPGISGESGEGITTDAPQPAATAEEPAQTGFAEPGDQEGGGVAEKGGFDFGEFDFDEGPVNAPTAEPFGAGEGGAFDFGELDLEPGDAAGREPQAPETTVPSFDDSAFSFAEEPMPPVPEVEVNIDGLEGPGAEGDAFTFDMALPSGQEEFSAASSAEFSFEPEAAEPAVAPPLPEPETAAEQPAPFDFGEFEFGEASPSEKTEKAEELAPEVDEWAWEQPAAPADAQTVAPPADEEIAEPPFAEMPAADDELPPLSISSRRKGSSILPIAVTAVSVLLVIALAGGGFYFFKEGPAAFDKVGLGFMTTWFGLEAKEEGGISIRNPAGAFLHNDEAGEIFVINGEAVNNFARPRASIQVKAVLYGPKGEALLQKTIYCGNALSREQLTTLTMAKLEAAMTNQFGDSLSNLAVQPGKGIPFVVVFTNVPQGAAEFGVEVAGSTVASQ